MILHFAKENGFKVSQTPCFTSEHSGARKIAQQWADSCVGGTSAPCLALPTALICCLQIGPSYWGLLRREERPLLGRTRTRD